MPANSDISLEGLGLRTVGRVKQPLTAMVTRELTLEDLAEREEESGTPERPQLKRLRQRHHMIARMLASGVSEGEIAVTARISSSHLSTLKTDPAMIELVQHYSSLQDMAFKEAQELASGLAIDALEELRERIETEPEKFSAAMLVKMAEFAMDRTGNGPSRTQQVDVRVGLADRLDEAQRRLARLRKINDGPGQDIIDVTPETDE